jgi:hypothetical protein
MADTVIIDISVIPFNFISLVDEREQIFTTLIFCLAQRIPSHSRKVVNEALRNGIDIFYW